MSCFDGLLKLKKGEINKLIKNIDKSIPVSKYRKADLICMYLKLIGIIKQELETLPKPAPVSKPAPAPVSAPVSEPKPQKPKPAPKPETQAQALERQIAPKGKTKPIEELKNEILIKFEPNSKTLWDNRNGVNYSTSSNWEAIKKQYADLYYNYGYRLPMSKGNNSKYVRYTPKLYEEMRDAGYVDRNTPAEEMTPNFEQFFADQMTIEQRKEYLKFMKIKYGKEFTFDTTFEEEEDKEVDKKKMEQIRAYEAERAKALREEPPKPKPEPPKPKPEPPKPKPEPEQPKPKQLTKEEILEEERLMKEKALRAREKRQEIEKRLEEERLKAEILRQAIEEEKRLKDEEKRLKEEAEKAKEQRKEIEKALKEKPKPKLEGKFDMPEIRRPTPKPKQEEKKLVGFHEISYEARLKKIFENKEMIKLIKKSKNMLDPTARLGEIIEICSSINPKLKITGIENNKKKVDYMKEKFSGNKNVNILETNYINANLNNNDYDLIIMYPPLENKYDYIFKTLNIMREGKISYRGDEVNFILLSNKLDVPDKFDLANLIYNKGLTYDVFRDIYFKYAKEFISAKQFIEGSPRIAQNYHMLFNNMLKGSLIEHVELPDRKYETRENPKNIDGYVYLIETLGY